MGSEIKDPVRISVEVKLVVAIDVVEAGEVVLPSRRSGYRQFCAAQQVIELRPIAGIGRLQRGAVEIPLAGNSGVTVGMAKANAQRGPIVERRADIRTFERIRVRVVNFRAISIELAAEQVVVEAAASPGQRSVSSRRREISAVRAKSKFGHRSTADTRPDLHHADHG